MFQKIRRSLSPYYEKFFSSWPAGFSPFPTNVMFELLYGCNLSCPFCYLRIEETVKKIKARRSLTTQEILKIIDQIPSLTSLSFSGGEVMLLKDIIKILKHAKQHHRVGIISNLTLNTKTHNQALVNMNLDTLMTSLDGYNAKLHDKVRGKGNFKKTTDNIADIQHQKKLQKKSYPTITINSMILPHNLKHLPPMVKLAKKLKVNYINFQLLDPSINRSGYELHRDLSHLRNNNLSKLPKINSQKLKSALKTTLNLAEKLKVKVSFSPQLKFEDIIKYYTGDLNLSRVYCNRVFHLSRISPFGEVYPCFNLKVGSVLKTPFMKLWNSKPYRHFRRQIKQGAYKPQCIGCCHLRLKP